MDLSKNLCVIFASLTLLEPFQIFNEVNLEQSRLSNNGKIVLSFNIRLEYTTFNSMEA